GRVVALPITRLVRVAVVWGARWATAENSRRKVRPPLWTNPVSAEKCRWPLIQYWYGQRDSGRGGVGQRHRPAGRCTRTPADSRPGGGRAARAGGGVGGDASGGLDP